MTEVGSKKEKLPAGLELIYELERQNVKRPLDAFMLAMHWSMVRAGLLLKSENPTHSDELTERLPANWPLKLLSENLDGHMSLDYYLPYDNTVKYELKVVELSTDSQVVVALTKTKLDENRETSNQPATANTPVPTTSDETPAAKNKVASTYFIEEFISNSVFTEHPEQLDWASNVFHHVVDLETTIWLELIEPIGLRVVGLPPKLGPYDDKTKPPTQERTTQTNNTQQRQPPRQPLQDDRRHPLPSVPMGGIGGRMGIPIPGGLGRSDLDPLGGIGAGMLADPRGFRNPRPGPGGLNPGQGFVPPGARFDPFGPPNPSRPGTCSCSSIGLSLILTTNNLLQGGTICSCKNIFVIHFLSQ